MSARYLITQSQGTINSGQGFKQFKVNNNLAYPVYINLRGEIPTVQNYQYIAPPRTDWVSPEVFSTSLSYFIPNFIPTAQVEIILSDSPGEQASMLTRAAGVLELCNGYPVKLADGTNDVVLPDIQLLNHLPVTFFINAVSGPTSVAHVLVNDWSVAGGISYGNNYMFACGNSGVFTFLPSHIDYQYIDRSVIRGLKLFRLKGGGSGGVNSAIHAYYSPQIYTDYASVEMPNAVIGLDVTSAASIDVPFGLNQGYYKLDIYYQIDVIGTTPALDATFYLRGVDSADVLVGTTAPNYYQVFATGIFSLAGLSADLPYRFMSRIINVPRPCFGQLHLAATGSTGTTLKVFPTVHKLG